MNESTREVFKYPELSAEDRMALRDLVQSDVWKLLQSEKVWKWYEGTLFYHLRKTRDDVRYYQGAYDALETAQQLVETLSKPPESVFTGTPALESKLMARQP